MKKQYVTYTSSMSNLVMEQLEKYVARNKTKKNVIIEQAVKQFLSTDRKKAYAETFKRANKDPEMIAMSDWGLEDYRNQLKSLEK